MVRWTAREGGSKRTRPNTAIMPAKLKCDLKDGSDGGKTGSSTPGNKKARTETDGNANATDALAYDPVHFIRSHSKNNDPADIQTQVRTTQSKQKAMDSISLGHRFIASYYISPCR